MDGGFTASLWGGWESNTISTHILPTHCVSEDRRVMMLMCLLCFNIYCFTSAYETYSAENITKQISPNNQL